MKVAYQQLRTSPDSRHDFSAVSLGVRVDETVESCLSLAVSSFIARRCLSRKLQLLNSGYVWHKVTSCENESGQHFVSGVTRPFIATSTFPSFSGTVQYIITYY